MNEFPGVLICKQLIILGTRVHPIITAYYSIGTSIINNKDKYSN